MHHASIAPASSSASTELPDSAGPAEPGVTPERAELIALVTRAQAGDLEAQSELVRRYTARIAGFVRPIITQPSAVEDVVQMVFIKMIRRLELLRDPRVFESWLFSLSHNTAVDFIRRRRCRPVALAGEHELEQLPDPSSPGTVEEIMEALAVALTRLSPRDRKLVTLIVQGNSYQTAAAREGLSVGAVKVRLNRVRPFLRVSVGSAIGLLPSVTKWRPPPRSRLAA